VKLKKRDLFVFLLAVLLTAPIIAEPSLDIKVDQVGYLPQQPKSAFISTPKAVGSFQVRQASDGLVVLEGKLGEAVYDPDSGDTLREADFSTLRKKGDFYLTVPGVGDSFHFRIASDVYSDAYYLCMRSYYGQRCGIKVDLSPRFPQYHHEACHLEDGEFHPSSGKTGKKDATKGWHDAGDYGKYVVNSGISCGTLLWAYEWYGKRIAPIRLDIPESGNGIPDLLNEVKWNLDWMLAMQDSDGGVWHKLTTEKFCGFVAPEKDDGGPRYIIGTGKEPYKSSGATADFAAVMAMASRIYGPFLPSYAQQCRVASERAWGWVTAHPQVTFTNPPGVSTGGYGDNDCGDEMLWASAELFRSTGKEEYNLYFLKNFKRYPVSDNWPQAWGTVANLGLWDYAFSERKETDVPTVENIKEQTFQAADRIVEASRKVGYHHSLRSANYIWGSNAVAANFGVMLLAANRIKPNTNYVSTALENLHYLLGRNTFSLCFVTQLGSHSVLHPHHRPSGALGLSQPWPGLLAGGPNRYPGDPVLRRLPPCPPARSYLDEQGSYSSNEVAINWNAPLVLLLAETLPNGKKMVPLKNENK
jgi:endoglucanase